MRVTKKDLFETYEQGWEREWLKHLSKNLLPRSKTYRIRMYYIAKMIDSTPSKIIDLGCGVGLHTFMLAKKYPGCKILGIDLSEKQIEAAKEIAQKNNLNITFRVGDIEKLTKENIQGFENPDYIIISEALEHLLYPDIALKKIIEISKDTTKIIITIPLRGKNYKGHIWYRQVDKNGKIIDTQNKNELKPDLKIYYSYHPYYTKQEVISLLEKNNLKIVDMHGSFLRIMKVFPPIISSIMDRIYFSYTFDKMINTITKNKYAGGLVIKCVKNIS